MTARMPEGCKVSVPIIYGSKAKPLTPEKATGEKQDHTHEWTVFLRAPEGVDLSGIVKRVSFKLHESFPNSLRQIDHAPFQVTETGWGEFEIGIKIYLQDPQEKVINLSHFLKLYPAPETWNSHEDLETIIAEKYDEIVFVQPHEYFYKPLTEYAAEATVAMEKETLLKRAMAEELAKVAKAISSLKESNKS
jgi:YEATS domain-containing protein 4